MFGKPLAEYLRFERVVLILLAAVGLARLGLSLAGAPNSAVRWLSMNAVVWAAAFYHGVVVERRGFGGFKQLLALVIPQVLLFQAIAVLGILLAIAGLPNVFSAPEYSFGVQSQWTHLAAHLTIGLVAPVLLLWAVSSLTLLVTKKLSRRPALA